MKDIFFGSSKQISRYSYLRRNVENMNKLKLQLNNSKLIIFNKSKNVGNRLEVLVKPNMISINNNSLALLNVKDHEIFNQLLNKWLDFNIRIQHNVHDKSTISYNNDIEDDLKNVSIFWLGFDDLKLLNCAANLKEDAIPIYAIDITNADKLSKFIDQTKEFENFKYVSNTGDILKLDNEEASLYSYAKMYIDFISKNNYCPSCAGHVVPVELGSRLYCLNDSPFNQKCTVNITSNNLQFPRTDAVVIISLYDELTGKILLGCNPKRHPPKIEKKINNNGVEITHKTTMYSCFAGFMEPSETVEHACIREVYEETGLRLNSNDIQIVESQPWPFPANVMIGCIGILRNEQTNAANINVHLDEELENVQWFDADNVNNVLQGKEVGVLSTANNVVDQWAGPPIESVAGRIIKRSIQKCIKDGKL